MNLLNENTHASKRRTHTQIELTRREENLDSRARHESEDGAPHGAGARRMKCDMMSIDYKMGLYVVEGVASLDKFI